MLEPLFTDDEIRAQVASVLGRPSTMPTLTQEQRYYLKPQPKRRRVFSTISLPPRTVKRRRSRRSKLGIRLRGLTR